MTRTFPSLAELSSFASENSSYIVSGARLQDAVDALLTDARADGGLAHLLRRGRRRHPGSALGTLADQVLGRFTTPEESDQLTAVLTTSPALWPEFVALADATVRAEPIPA